MPELQTPYFYIREEDLLYDIQLLQNALQDFWGNYIIGYSVKTNSLPWLLTYLKKHHFYAEIVSDEEYELCAHLGYENYEMIYNGPIKNRQYLESVLLQGGYVNLDSSQELDWLEELSGHYPGKRFSVGLRVNCDLSSICPGEKLAYGEGGRFGYCYESGCLGETISRLSKLPNLEIAGLHLHSSTQSRTVSVYRALAKMAVKIASEYNLKLEYVDMGGGYFGGRPDKPDYRDYFQGICEELSCFFDPVQTKIIAEPGVSLISRATAFHTTVQDLKDIRGQRYLVTDGSRTNLNPLVTRHVYPHHIVYRSKEVRPVLSSQWVCGFTCMEYDRLFEITAQPALTIGDRIVYDTAGGYTMSLNPLFIRYLPPVYVEYCDGRLYTAREKWGIEEYLQKNNYE